MGARKASADSNHGVKATREATGKVIDFMGQGAQKNATWLTTRLPTQTYSLNVEMYSSLVVRGAFFRYGKWESLFSHSGDFLE